MNREQKYDRIEYLKAELDKAVSECRKQPANIKLRIKKDKIRIELKETKLLFTDEDFEKMMQERESIDAGKINV